MLQKSAELELDGITLTSGDVLIIGNSYKIVEHGSVECWRDGKIKVADSALFVRVPYEEVCDLHDAGCIVFEISDAYTGPWRSDI